MAVDFHAMTLALMADFRANGGRVTSGPFVGRQLLLLTTTGAKSGTQRTTPLVYTRDGDRLVIVASKGGSDQHPHWYHNIVSHPIVTLEVGSETFSARATVADPDERRRLYDAHADTYPGFLDYEKKTDRVIPVVILERVAEHIAAA
jgi:deazaflavin-dependent oxidoreductase (nitroreductase family)